MLPLIIESNHDDATEEYIQKFIKEHAIVPHHIFTISPLKSEITIDQIRALKKELITMTPFKRMVILRDFDTANLESQNALLKTLEEKHEQNYFLMIVHNYNSVIDTIQSRSKYIALTPHTTHLLNNTTRSLLSHIADYTFLNKVSSINREGAIQFFDESIMFLKEQLKEGKMSTVHSLKKAMELKNLLVYNNLNPQMSIDSFLLFYKRQLNQI
jgi:hypothetical protein